MYQYPYTKQENSSSIPIITITLKNIDNYNLIVSNCDGILDTGADYTLIPVSLLSKLQISPIGKIKYLQGIGNNKIGVIPFRIAFNFYSEKFINVKVFGCAENETQGFIIIGRNILNRYCITFDGINEVFTISI